MGTRTALTRTGRVVAVLTAATMTSLVAWEAPAIAGTGTSVSGTGIQWQGQGQLDSSWTYGNSLVYQADPRWTGGRVLTATSATPKVCQVATQDDGSPAAVRLVDVGVCTVGFHLDGDATEAPYDGAISHSVAPRDLTLSCHDVRRASDEVDPALTPVFDNLAPWDAPSDFTIRPDVAIPAHLPAGRWPVSPLTTSPVNPDTGAPRYRIRRTPCTLTVDPVLEVTGMPRDQAADLTVDGQRVDGSRFVFPWGSKVTYSVAPVLGGTAPVYGQQHKAPEAWFASAATGTATRDATVTYSTFGELVAASPFSDLFKKEFMSYDVAQYGWLAARSYLTPGYDGLDEGKRLARLQDIVGDLQRLIRNAALYYLGRQDWATVNSYADQLVSYLQLIRDRGGVPS
jgi:hypothetical protein